MNCAFSLLQCGRKPALTLSILSAFALSGCSSFSEFDNGSVASMTQAVPEFGRRSLNTVTRSVPELGMLTDKGTSGRSITIRLSDQRAFLYRGRSRRHISRFNRKRRLQHTHRQAPGDRQDIDHRSSIYGRMSAMAGRQSRVDVRKDPCRRARSSSEHQCRTIFRSRLHTACMRATFPDIRLLTDASGCRLVGQNASTTP
jgi:hypothetical protein